MGYDTKPIAMPLEMLYVNGMVIIAKNAGIASAMFSHLMLTTARIIKAPTIIRAGAVMADTPAKAVMRGVKNNDSKKPMATTTPVSPVRPPMATPEADPTYAVTVGVPEMAQNMVPMEPAAKDRK